MGCDMNLIIFPISSNCNSQVSRCSDSGCKEEILTDEEKEEVLDHFYHCSHQENISWLNTFQLLKVNFLGPRELLGVQPSVRMSAPKISTNLSNHIFSESS